MTVPYIAAAAGIIIIAVIAVFLLSVRDGSTRHAINQAEHVLRLKSAARYSVCIFENAIEIWDMHNNKNNSLEYRYNLTNANDKIFSCAAADIYKDKSDEILLITGNKEGKYGQILTIFTVANDTMDAPQSAANTEKWALEEIYKADMSELNIWKVQTCDVDGDGNTEISLGVFKTAEFHPVMAKRPFIYNWHDGRISPKWLGSRLSRPFDDYIFCDVDADGRDELLAIEHLEDGKKVVNTYVWKGFGFESIGQSEGFDEIYEISKSGPSTDDAKAGIDARISIDARVSIDGAEARVSLAYKNGKLERWGFE